MAINPAIAVITNSTFANSSVELITGWTQVGSDTYLQWKDADNITDPGGEITDSSRQVFSTGSRAGTLLSARMRYSEGNHGSDPPIIKLFGRVRTGQASEPTAWQLLRASDGELTVTLNAKGWDVLVAAGARVTTVHLSETTFPTQGCNEFLVGVEQKFSPTSPGAFASLEVRLT